MSSAVFDDFLSPPAAREPFGEASVLQAMFSFEAALARAQAGCGLMPAAAAQAIASVCKVELYDTLAIVQASGRAGSLAIPLVRELTRTVALVDADAARHVHKGSTSQDVIDTAMVLVTRQSLRLLDQDVQGLVLALAKLAQEHADTPVLARTLMQPAQVTSLGWKFLGWMAPLVRARARLHEQATHSLCLQLGGPVGTLASMGPRAAEVAQAMAHDLRLSLPAMAWHTRRDDWLRLASEVALLTGTLGKIATDLSLMSQAEVAELSEPSAPGRGGSSAMPHKRNPVACMTALAAAQRAPGRMATLLGAMGQQHERGLGNWQAELAEWPGLFIGAHAAAHALREAAQGLGVHPQAMRRNIDGLHGLVFAEAASLRLAAVMGREPAQTLLETLSRQAHAQGRSLLDLLRAEYAQGPQWAQAVSTEEMAADFDPVAASRPAATLVREHLPRLLSEHAALQPPHVLAS